MQTCKRESESETVAEWSPDFGKEISNMPQPYTSTPKTPVIPGFGIDTPEFDWGLSICHPV